jgi:DNA repair protein RecN (Recombination protein N)
LDEVEARLGLIHDLKRKYGRDIPAIQAYAARAAEELESVEHSEQRRIELSREQQRLVERMGELGEQMSAQRSQAAQQLSSLIASELDQLQMAGARFEVQLVWEDDPDGVAAGDRKVKFGPQGLDQVEFLIAPNVGEGLKPLVKVASGGETSRLMLGLKSVLARADQRTTLIFDEIDQGIGGRVGAVVGQKLRNLTADHQVLCVTHLPQLAAYAEQHFQVEKQVETGRTQAIARRLEPEQRVAELAEMLGGDSDANRRSAEALLLTASGEMKQVAALEGAA